MGAPITRRELLLCSGLAATAVLRTGVRFLDSPRNDGRRAHPASPRDGVARAVAAATGSMTRPRARWGVYCSAAPGDLAPVDALAGALASPPELVLWYEAWQSPYAAPAELAWQCQRVISAGYSPLLTWMTVDQTARRPAPGYSDSEIASGSREGYIRACATALAALGAPVFLRLDHEMNGMWSPWAPGRRVTRQASNTASGYVAMWRRVWRLFRDEGATNVVWVWSPNVSYRGAPPLAPLYPGDEHVDVLGMDGYNSSPARWITPSALFGPTYEQLVAIDAAKPVLIAETGSIAAGRLPHQSRAAWIEQLPAALAAMPRIGCVVWSDARQYRLDGEAVVALRAVFGPQGPSPAPTRPAAPRRYPGSHDGGRRTGRAGDPGLEAGR